ncbi:Uncharacterized protein pbN1_40740 [Aromatoleum bremense]|nr:Uncharacterized protein pbN1_40740 [Aromatoleum bremense]
MIFVSRRLRSPAHSGEVTLVDPRALESERGVDVVDAGERLSTGARREAATQA